MPSRFVCALFATLIVQPQIGQNLNGPTLRQAGVLRPNQPIDQDIAPRQADVFSVDVAPGQFVRVVADQQGTDVTVQFIDADGKTLVRANRPNADYGPEAASTIVVRGGLLSVRVEMSSPTASDPGHYRIQLTDLRDPTADDRSRIDAETRLFRAVDENRANDAPTRRKAIEDFTEAAKIWTGLRDDYEHALCLHAAGGVYLNLRENQQALDQYQQALTIRHAMGDQGDEGATLNNMGLVFEAEGDMRKAVDYFQQSLQLLRASGRAMYEGRTLINLGRMYSALGEKAKAFEADGEALQLFRNIDNNAGDGFARTALSQLSALSRPPQVRAAGVAEPPKGTPSDMLRVELVAQAGHSFQVKNIAFSPDGQLVLTTTEGERVALLWNASNGKEIRAFAGQAQITCAAFLPDGKRVVTASFDKTIRIWDISTGRELTRLTDSMPVTVIAVSRDGNLVATAFGIPNTLVNLRSAHIWDLRSGTQIHSLDGHTGTIDALAFSRDGNWVVTGSSDQTARLWDVHSGKEVARFAGHESTVTAVSISPDGMTLVTGSGASFSEPLPPQFGVGMPRAEFEMHMKLAAEAAAAAAEHTIRWWNISSGKEVRKINAGGPVLAVTFSVDGKYVAASAGLAPGGPSVCVGCELRLWDVSSGEEVKWSQEQSTSTKASRALAFSSTSDSLAVSMGNEVSVLDRQTGLETARLRGLTSDTPFVSVSPNGRFTFASGSSQLWDHDTGRPTTVIGSSDRPAFGSVSSDGSLLVLVRPVDGLLPSSVGPPRMQFTLWDTRTHTETKSFPTAGFPSQWNLSPDGRVLLVRAIGQPPCTFNVMTVTQVRCFGTAADSRAGAFFSPAGDAVIGLRITSQPERERTTVQVWETRTGEELRSFQIPVASQAGSSFGSTAAVSPTGETIAVTGPSTFLYNWRTGQPLRELYTGFSSSLAFLPDGRGLAVGNGAGYVSLWDTASGKQKWESFSETPVFSVQVTADGRFVLTTGPKGQISVLDSDSGKPVCLLTSFDDGSWAVTDPEGRYDASNPDEAIGLHWVAGTEIIELGQLKQRFYTPGLYARILKGERLPDVASIQTVKLFPEVEFQAPAAGSTVLKVKLNNRGGGIGRVVVRVNGKEVSSDIRGPRTDSNAPSTEVSVDLAGAIRAADGQNAIEVVAYDGLNLLSSRGSVRVWTTEKASSKPPHLFAVIAGVSDYDNPGLNLKYPSKDAEDIYRAMRLAADGLLGKENVSLHLLTTDGAPGSAAPTKAEFRRVFTEIAKQAEPQDVLLIYLAGHGVARKGVADEYYYLTRSARSTELTSDLNMLDLATVSSDELLHWAVAIKALKQVIILDTCAAGAAISELNRLASRRELTPDQARAIELLKDRTGSHIIAGSAPDAVSYESNRYGQGLLTFALLQGMKGEALQAGKQVDVATWFNFAAARVTQLAYDIGGFQQPQVSSPGGQSFLIGLLSDDDKRAIVLANAKPQLLRVQCSDDQEEDSLGLRALLRARLGELSRPATRGTGDHEPAVVYLDEDLDIPSAIRPVVRYVVQRDRIEARITLVRDGKRVSSETVSTSRDLSTAARQIADAIVTATTKLSPQ